jgi:hypothetical protein
LCSNEARKAIDLSLDLSEFALFSNELGVLNIKSLNLNRNNEYKLRLKPGQVHSLKIFLSPAVKIAQIPSISLRYGKHRSQLPPLSINITNLNRPSLVGSRMENSLEDFHRKISTANNVITTVVSGKSGVGKSRFLEEAEIRLLRQNFTVIQIDGQSGQSRSFNSFAASLLSQIWRLPNPRLIKNEDEQFFSTVHKDSEYDRNAFGLENGK